MVDMFTASVITKAYEKVNDANKKKMEKANVQTLVRLAQKVMGMKEDADLNSTVEGFASDAQRRAAFASGYKEKGKKGKKKEEVQEGVWAVPDSISKMKELQKLLLKPLYIKSDADERKVVNKFKNLIGNDEVYDEWYKMMLDYQDTKKVGDARDPVVKWMKSWGFKLRGYKITHAPEAYLKDEIEEKSKIKRPRGNIKKPRGKMMTLKMSKEDQLKEEREHAKQSPFKLKSQQYPRAIGVDTKRFR
jgi:hypothetical protein